MSIIYKIIMGVVLIIILIISAVSADIKALCVMIFFATLYITSVLKEKWDML